MEEEVLKECIQRDGVGELVTTSFPLMDIPVIDLGPLMNHSNTSNQFNQLVSALSTWGCFQAINHGMTPEFLDKVRQIAKEFFELSVEEKNKYSSGVNEFEGYGKGMFLSRNQNLNCGERVYLTIYPQDQRKLQYCPETFRTILHELAEKSKLLADVILKAMARSLNLEDKCFIEQYGEEAKLRAKFTLYPKCPRPDLVLGAEPHADGTAITLLLQDKNVEGLQYLKDNEWFKAPIIPEALLINVGDQAEGYATILLTQISSNGIFKSRIHRVVTNSERERLSLAIFYIPEQEREIEPFQKLVNESRPQLYKKVKDYSNIYLQSYRQGKTPIEAAKYQI